MGDNNITYGNSNNLDNAIAILNKLRIPIANINIEQETKNGMKTIKNLKLIGEGRNADVYKGTFDNKDASIKIMDLYLDTPIIKVFTNNKIISQTGINDIIISNLLSQINSPLIQKFYGYKIFDDYGLIIMVKEWCDYDFKTFISSNNDEVINNIFVHYLFGLKLIFQQILNGYMIDVKLENILIRRYTDEFMIYNINNKQYKVKCYGYLPVFTDFGSSIITRINNDNILINRHVDWKKQHKTMYGYWLYHGKTIDMTTLPNNYKLDTALDLFHLIFIRTMNSKHFEPTNISVIKLFMNMLKNRKILTIGNYFPNCLTLDNFLEKLALTQKDITSM